MQYDSYDAEAHEQTCESSRKGRMVGMGWAVRVHGLFPRIYSWSRRCESSSCYSSGNVIGVCVLGGLGAGYGERRWQRVSGLTGVFVVTEGVHAVNGTGVEF